MRVLLSIFWLRVGGIGIYIDIYLYEVNAKHISSNVLEVSEISRAHSKRLKGLQFQHM